METVPEIFGFFLWSKLTKASFKLWSVVQSKALWLSFSAKNVFGYREPGTVSTVLITCLAAGWLEGGLISGDLKEVRVWLWTSAGATLAVWYSSSVFYTRPSLHLTVFKPTAMDAICAHIKRKKIDIWVVRGPLPEFVSPMNNFGNQTGLGI